MKVPKLQLAPLAGVSDAPFRRVCEEAGADMSWVEMLSATALVRKNPRTLEMLSRFSEESNVGVQITGTTAEEVAAGVGVINQVNFAAAKTFKDNLTQQGFSAIDINMGCPVKKIVKTGCGSAILKDPERVYQTVKQSVAASDLPVTAKIRLGWDRSQMNYLEVAHAIEDAGASWITVHGRTRSDDYSVPVGLQEIAEIKDALEIPVIGNGNIFTSKDIQHFYRCTGVDGLMVSRGALGNPWVFRSKKPTPDEWLEVVLKHFGYQKRLYGEDSTKAWICMRKHLLWYAKGWPEASQFKARAAQIESLQEGVQLAIEFANHQKKQGVRSRDELGEKQLQLGFSWDPKYEMDREYDKDIYLSDQ